MAFQQGEAQNCRVIEMFQDLWAAMTPKQREGICWLAEKDGELYGEGSDTQMMSLAIAAINALARDRSTNYEEYRQEVIELCQGAAKGLLDGGITYYLQNPKGL